MLLKKPDIDKPNEKRISVLMERLKQCDGCKVERAKFEGFQDNMQRLQEHTNRTLLEIFDKNDQLPEVASESGRKILQRIHAEARIYAETTMAANAHMEEAIKSANDTPCDITTAALPCPRYDSVVQAYRVVAAQAAEQLEQTIHSDELGDKDEA